MKRYLLLPVMLVFSFALITGLSSSQVFGQKNGEGKQEEGAGKINPPPAAEPRKEQPDTFKEDARKTFHDLNRQIHDLGKKAKSQWAGAETGAKEAWKDVKVKQRAAKKQVRALGTASKDTWEQTKSQTKDALEELRKSFDKAKAYFK